MSSMFKKLMVCVIALLVSQQLPAREMLARSVLILDQSEPTGPFYYQLFAGFRATLNDDSRAPTTIYQEALDLSRFSGSAYEEETQRHLQEKYQDRPIGAVVAVGIATLELVLRWRDKLWPKIPVVFAMVDESDFAQQNLPAEVTGSIVKQPLSDLVKAARAVVPNLERVFFVGDPWGRQVVYRNWDREKSSASGGLQITDFVGLSMSETRKRVETLPERSVIIYSAMYSDGEGTFYPPATALAFIAQKANRPIIVAAETFLEPGGIGGFVLLPAVMGVDAAKLVLRILDGEPVANIPVSVTQAVKPIFNWQQMQRWRVSKSDLPAGSEIRFYEPPIWERYRWQSITVACLIFVQTVLIFILLHERRKRNDAELEARHRMTELAHVNRRATAGELSSTMAHELNQPLGAILTNTETADLILNSPAPDLNEIKEIIADIKRDDKRASEIIGHMRNFLKTAPFEIKHIDINDTVREVFDFLSAQASARNVALSLKLFPKPLPVKGDPVQLQQVVLNLVLNSMDAMNSMSNGRAVVARTVPDGPLSALISISDTGPGIPSEKFNEIFNPFFTTKQQGLGIGLSIARTIVQAHRGRIWAENQAGGGASFHVSLALALF